MAKAMKYFPVLFIPLALFFSSCGTDVTTGQNQNVNINDPDCQLQELPRVEPCDVILLVCANNPRQIVGAKAPSCSECPANTGCDNGSEA